MNEAYPFAETCVPSTLAAPYWIGHIPFAFELVHRLRPRTVVELGTYTGTSLSAFCKAADACGLDTRCHGIDLWAGDPHMGGFDESVFRAVTRSMTLHHPHNSVLLRKSFRDAAADFGEASIDLLHIDGTHTYEAVSEDFHTWLPKMSGRGVILLHDTHVTEQDVGEGAGLYGVRRLFDEVKGSYPHFEFDHCFGLGVLLVGETPAAEVLAMVQASRHPNFHEFFAARGDAMATLYEELHGVRYDPHDASTSTVIRAALRRIVNRTKRGIRTVLGLPTPS